MSNLLKILARERETYYDYSTGKLTKVWPIWLCIFLFSTFLVLGLDSVSNNFLAALLTVYSILTGFGFSVLFNLASAKKITLSEDDYSLEKKPMVTKVNKLKDELFTNISYFSIGGLILVTIVLWLIFLDDISFDFLNYIKTKIETLTGSTKSFELIANTTKQILLVLFITALINNLWSFFRIIIRLNFYFSERMKLIG